MSTYLDRFNDDERLAATREALTLRANALVAMGLIKQLDDAYEVQPPGFGRGTFLVTADGLCTCEETTCVHALAVRMFVEQPEKPKPATRPINRPVDPNNRYSAKAIRALCTPRQGVAIGLVASTLGIDAQALSNERYSCNYHDLSIYWAGKFYEALCEMRANRGGVRIK